MRTLILGKIFPEPASSAAGTRMMQLIEFFLAEGDELWFGSPASPSRFSAALPAQVNILEVTLNDSAFDERLRELDPDLVIFDRFTTEEQFGWRVAEQCPDALRVLNSEDLHCLRDAREQAVKDNRDFREDDLINETAFREIASVYRCDLTLVISSAETDILRRYFRVDEKLIFYLPFLYEHIGEYHSKMWPDFHKRQGFVWIGNFLHAPNADAVHYLKNEIWPLLRAKLPQAQLLVYGAYGEKFNQLHEPYAGFFMKGRATDSREVQRQARVNLSPLRFGAGLKGKLAEAMICGTPSVTTTTGAEGLTGTLPWPGAIAPDVSSFVSEAVRLHEDEKYWKKAQDKIRPFFNNMFNGVRDQKRLKIKLDDLVARLKEHRKRNFTGAMLNHQMVHAKRWLSKYLELKNQVKPQSIPNRENSSWQAEL